MLSYGASRWVAVQRPLQYCCASGSRVHPACCGAQRTIVGVLVPHAVRSGALLHVCPCRMVRYWVEQRDFSQLKNLLSILQKSFTRSANPNARKGGLLGLAATAVALGRVRMLTPPTRPDATAGLQCSSPHIGECER